MNDEFKALTIGDLCRVVERHNDTVIAGDVACVNITGMDEVVHVLVLGHAGDYLDAFVESVQRIAREILAERTSSEALKRAARVEELDKAAVPGHVAEYVGRAAASRLR